MSNKNTNKRECRFNNLNHFSRRDFSKLVAMTGVASMSPLLAYGKSEKNATEPPLFTEYGVCMSYKKFPVFKEAGYHFIEETTAGLLMPARDDAAFAKTMESLKKSGAKVLACNSFIPGSLRSVGNNANHEGVLNHADTVFKRAKLTGVKGIVFGSSGSRKLKDGFKREKAEVQFVDLLKKMAPLAHAQGVEIWLEPLNRKEDNFINTQAQGAAIIEKVNHPALGMVCDIYHVARNEETPEELVKTMKYVRHCHIAEKKKRSAPSIENYDFTPYLKAIKKGGYSGSISMECGWDNIEERPAQAIDYLKKQVTMIATKQALKTK